MSEHNPSRKHSLKEKALRTAGAGIAATALYAAGAATHAEFFNQERPDQSVSANRALAAQEAMYYEEAVRIADLYQAQLRAGKTINMPYLRGKITGNKNVSGTAKEFGSIKDPIFLVPGPETRDGAAHNDRDLDGGFVGVQSFTADNQIAIEVVPFNRDTMHFSPAAPNAKDSFSSAEVQTRTIHGELNGSYAVGINTVTKDYLRDSSGVLVIPGLAPNQAK